MLRIILSGCRGRMGDEINQFCRTQSDVSIVAGFSKKTDPKGEYPIFSLYSHCTVDADVLVDFSHPDALPQLLLYCKKYHLPAVLGVTGYSDRQLESIQDASTVLPIFRAANFSLGANVLLKLTKTAAGALGSIFDADIIERHHRNKLDSPSGTAMMLSFAAERKLPIHSIRSGSTAGEHTVLFAGPNEVLELTHRADCRSVYASGALRAARFIAAADRPGLYGMEDLLGSE